MESPSGGDGNSGIAVATQGIDASPRRKNGAPGACQDLRLSGDHGISSHMGEYDAPGEAIHLSELSAPSPVQNPEEQGTFRHESLEERVNASQLAGRGNEAKRASSSRSGAQIATADGEFESGRRERRGGPEEGRYEAPGEYGNLNEVGSPAPDQNPDEARVYRFSALEERRRKSSRGASASRQSCGSDRPPARPRKSGSSAGRSESNSQVSRLLTELYTVSYLIFFSILGTLARLGLNALTNFAGAPVTASVIWANFAGTLILGFLAEGSAIFNHVVVDKNPRPMFADVDEEAAAPTPLPSNSDARRDESEPVIRKPIPLYIGLATGFCGSLTSFSSFMRDFFLEMTNNPSAPQYHPADSAENAQRGGGKDFMAMMAVLIATACISLSALKFGAHTAILLGRFNYRLSYSARSVFDKLAVFLGVGCWVGAVIMAAVPPDRHWAHSERWRGQVLFAIVFAPLGCMFRFYLSVKLNGRFSSFPLGTFAANTIGTAVLGMAWDLQRLPLDDGLIIVSCQVLQGIMDGFCGCLTTVSTLALELSSLRRYHAYTYGGISVLSSLAILTLVMGAMKWTVGWAAPACA
jgi:CrcB protein